MSFGRLIRFWHAGGVEWRWASRGPRNNLYTFLTHRRFRLCVAPVSARAKANLSRVRALRKASERRKEPSAERSSGSYLPRSGDRPRPPPARAALPEGAQKPARVAPLRAQRLRQSRHRSARGLPRFAGPSLQVPRRLSVELSPRSNAAISARSIARTSKATRNTCQRERRRFVSPSMQLGR